MHRRLLYIYLLNVPSFSSRYFNKIKRTSRLGRLLALSLEILWEAYIVITLSVCPSVRPALCSVHISYILWGRNSRFGVWMQLGMAECHISFSGHCDLDLWLSFYSNHNVRPSVPLRVQCISPIFFEVGIPNLMCGCILGWRSVAYHFRVTVTLTLTSDLVFRIIMSRAYLLYYFR